MGVKYIAEKNDLSLNSAASLMELNFPRGNHCPKELDEYLLLSQQGIISNSSKGNSIIKLKVYMLP